MVTRLIAACPGPTDECVLHTATGRQWSGVKPPVLRGDKWSASYSNSINTRQSSCGGNGSGWAPEQVSKGAGWEVSPCETPSCSGGLFWCPEL